MCGPTTTDCTITKSNDLVLLAVGAGPTGVSCCDRRSVQDGPGLATSVVGDGMSHATPFPPSQKMHLTVNYGKIPSYPQLPEVHTGYGYGPTYLLT